MSRRRSRRSRRSTCCPLVARHEMLSSTCCSTTTTHRLRSHAQKPTTQHASMLLQNGTQNKRNYRFADAPRQTFRRRRDRRRPSRRTRAERARPSLASLCIEIENNTKQTTIRAREATLSGNKSDLKYAAEIAERPNSFTFSPCRQKRTSLGAKGNVKLLLLLIITGMMPAFDRYDDEPRF